MAWPVYAALFVVVVISITVLAVDLAIDQRTADQTAALVEDSLRSIALADDLRYQAYRLSVPNLTTDQAASIAEQIDVDARAYDLLARGVGESAAWNRLEGLLAHLRHEQPLATAGSPNPLIPEIETTITRLVDINQSEARRAADQISRAHHSGLVIDSVLGTATLVLAALVALALRRVMRRERNLLSAYLAATSERQNDLAAFASRISHDLKAPLSPIRGYADVLSLHASPEVSDPAKRISHNVRRMTALIDELLNLSISGSTNAGTTPITPVVYQALEDLRTELADAEVSLDLGNLIARCSAEILGQAVTNVLSNAAKYRSPDRRLTIRIEARAREDGIAITLRDNGLGMDQETVEHALEPSYRAPGSSAPGHGLGLSIVKRVLGAVGGDVQLESKAEQGTSVRIVVPAG